MGFMEILASIIKVINKVKQELKCYDLMIDLLKRNCFTREIVAVVE